MPRTALVHFGEDVGRARAIVGHAEPLPQTSDEERLLRSDLFRSAWMFAVGAFDAFFCDAYTDVVAATVISKSRHSAMTLPQFFNRIEFPVRAILPPLVVLVSRLTDSEFKTRRDSVHERPARRFVKPWSRPGLESAAVQCHCVQLPVLFRCPNR
jgi:hypothetical protein